MKIWHVGACSSPNRVDGVSRTVWLLSRHQAALGHDVALVVDTPPDETAIQIARDSGLRLIHVQSTYLTYPDEIRRVLEREKPDLVHMHSVFIIRQATLGRILKTRNIPYVITPHGGLAPQVLKRGVVKKTVYGWLRERPRFMGADAIALVTPTEERAVRSFLPRYRKIVRWMPNPVAADILDPHSWQGVRDPKRVVFLGRFDVVVKGIDILLEIARLIPEVKVDLYGSEDPKTLAALNRLRQNVPGNVEFHSPIFGAEKGALLAGASLYLQPSRWEGFPVSVAECLYLGVPSAITGTLDLAHLFRQENLGLVIPLDPPRAAAQIREALADGARLKKWSDRGREFARRHFHPAAVAQNHIDLYRQILAQRSPAVSGSASPFNEMMNGDMPVSVNGHELKLANGNGHANGQANGHANGNGRLNGHANGHGRTNGHANGNAQHTGGWHLMPAHLRGAMKANVSRLVERSNCVFGNEHQPRTIVLCYHSINRSDADLSVDAEIFRQQLIYLKQVGFKFMNFGDLAARLLRSGTPRDSVACVTFDDGYEDNLTQAAPILNSLGIPATTFVTTGLMDRDAGVLDHFKSLTRYDTRYLSRQQVVSLARAGFEISAHTHTHPNLARLGAEQMRTEVADSKARLEDALGQTVRSFAYPFGKRNIHYTDATVDAVREAGYVAAAAVAFRAVTARESVRIYEIPRFFVTRSDDMTSFEQKVNGHFDWLGTIQEGAPAWLKAMVSPEDTY